MLPPQSLPTLPADLEATFSSHADDPLALINAFMPLFCNYIEADRIFIQARNPDTCIYKVMRYRRNSNIPWPAIPGSIIDDWFVEVHWEDEDPLWRAALQLEPSIYVENPEIAAADGLLNLDFENSYMFHKAFIHGHALWPPLPLSQESPDPEIQRRNFYGSVQPAVFGGFIVWSKDVHDLVEKCLVRIAPVIKAYGETAPDLMRKSND